MQYKNYTDPIINNYRRDEQGAKQAKQISGEQHKVVNGKVALSELPDEEQALSIEGYNETKDWNTELKDKQFRVDYTNGFIYFSPTQDGQSVSVNYFGLGVTYFPASRVWLEVDGENNVKKTLGDVQGDIEEAKKLSENQEQLKKDLDEQGGKLKDMVNEIQRVDLTEIENSVSNAKQAENSLKATTNEAEAKIANVNETKKQLDTSIQSAKDEGKSLDTKIEQSKVNKADIDSACEKLNQAKSAVDGSVKQANDSISSIDEKVNTGNQVKTELDNSIQQANNINSTLSNTKQEANQANSELTTSQKTADKTKADLEALKSESTSLSSDLTEKNTEAKENIEGLKSQNKQAKDNIAGLQNESKVAVEKKDSLLSENTKASQTIEQIETLIQSSTDLKNRLEEIIASGDLGKYVTDPKLQNILTSYATKDDLSKIDLTEKLTEYAKTVDVNKQVASLTNLIDNKVDKVDGYGLSKNDYTDVDKAKVKAIPDNPKYTDTVPDLSGYATKSSIPTSLSQLADDETHRLISDDEKEKLKNIESGANKYVHPNTHSASMIKETTDKMFVSDAEKAKWNNPDLSNYVQKDGSKVLSSNDYTNEEKAQVASIPDYLKKKDLQDALRGTPIDNMMVAWIQYRNLNGEDVTIKNKRCVLFLRDILEDISILDHDNRILDDIRRQAQIGYQLSENDYTDEAKAKVDSIPANPKYTDTAALQTTTISDMNLLDEMGVYNSSFSSNCPNGSPGKHTVFVLPTDASDAHRKNYLMQIAIKDNVTNSPIYYRTKRGSSTWGSWFSTSRHTTEVLTESAYNNLSSRDDNTLYFIK